MSTPVIVRQGLCDATMGARHALALAAAGLVLLVAPKAAAISCLMPMVVASHDEFEEVSLDVRLAAVVMERSRDPLRSDPPEVTSLERPAAPERVRIGLRVQGGPPVAIDVKAASEKEWRHPRVWIVPRAPLAPKTKYEVVAAAGKDSELRRFASFETGSGSRRPRWLGPSEASAHEEPTVEGMFVDFRAGHAGAAPAVIVARTARKGKLPALEDGAWLFPDVGGFVRSGYCEPSAISYSDRAPGPQSERWMLTALSDDGSENASFELALQGERFTVTGARVPEGLDPPLERPLDASPSDASPDSPPAPDAPVSDSGVDASPRRAVSWWVAAAGAVVVLLLLALWIRRSRRGE